MDDLARQTIKPCEHRTATLVQRCSSYRVHTWKEVQFLHPKGEIPMISEAFDLDYMGSSEFEWGSVPAAIRQMAQAAKDHEFDYFKVEGLTNWEGKSVHVYCHPDHFKQIAGWLLLLATAPFHKNLHLKECSRFDLHFSRGDRDRAERKVKLERAKKNLERAKEKGHKTVEKWEKEVYHQSVIRNAFFGADIDFWFALNGIGGGFAFAFSETLLGDFARGLNASVKYMDAKKKVPSPPEDSIPMDL